MRMKNIISNIGGLLLCLQLLLVLHPSSAYAQEEKSYVRAILIYKFIPFVSWGKNNFPNDGSEKHSICTIGYSDVSELLEMLAEKREKKNFVLFRDIKLEDINNCNVLYVGNLSHMANKNKKEKDILKEIVSKSKIHHILTVSNLDGFIKNGGMIAFVERDDMVKFKISMLAVEKAGLSLEAILLELAVKIYR